ncbi:MAG: zf-TFIIB domain-containing protein [Gemmataceae bacterium]
MATPLSCPRCSGELRRGHFDSLDVHLCVGCKGVLARQRDLSRLLESVARDTAANDQPGAVIEAIPDKGAGVVCPLCSGAMENYGYMESKLVKIDGCMRCGVVWIDTDELGVMSLLYARSQRKLQGSYMKDPGLTNLVSASFLARAAENSLMSSFVLWDE